MPRKNIEKQLKRNNNKKCDDRLKWYFEMRNINYTCMLNVCVCWMYVYVERPDFTNLFIDKTKIHLDIVFPY